MPIHREGSGWQWGNHGKVYPTRAGAERQAAAAHAHGYNGDQRAAGIALRAPDGSMLFLRRGPNGDHPGEWCFPGGSCEGDETPEQAAIRELTEETGLGPEILSPMISLGYDENFATFGSDVAAKSIPTLNAEHTAFAWAQPMDAPQPLHPGVAALFAAPLPVLPGMHKDHAGYYAPMTIGETRRMTPEGFLICEATPIARTGEQLYAAHELEGLEPNGAGYIIVSRPPEEVFRDETLASFEGKDFVINHPPDGVDPENWKNHTVGHIQNLRRGEGIDDDLLLADIVVKDPRAIEYVNRHKPEISAGYNADYEQTEPGRAICKNILGNHAAAVKAGRAGARVAVRDSAPAPVISQQRIMKMSKRTFGTGLRDALVRMGLKTADVNKLEEEHGEDTAPTTVSGDAIKDAVRDAMGAYDKRLGDIEKELSDRRAKDEAKEAEEKARKEAADRVAEDARAKDAAREAEEKKSEETGDTLIEAEEVGHTINLGKTWTGGMTGDAAEPVLSSIVARAEILAPGIAKPTADSLKGSRGKNLAAFMRTALTTHASKDSAGNEAIRAVCAGKSIADLRGQSLVTAFNSAAHLARVRNNGSARTSVIARGQRTGDFSTPSTIASINERNRNFWANGGKK